MKRIFHPSSNEIENSAPPREIPKMFAFSGDEKEKVSRWLVRMMVDMEFRIEETGEKPVSKTALKWWKGQRAYYRHARKFCKFLLHHLELRDNFLGSEPE